MKKIICWALVVACMAGIFCFSAQNGEESDSTSGGVTEFILSIFVPSFEELSQEAQQQKIDSIHSFIRVAAHFSSFALLGFLAYLALDNYEIKHKILYSQVISSGYAISDEIHQYFVPDRAFQISDILVDSLGAICGILFCLLVKTIIKKIKSKKTA